MVTLATTNRGSCFYQIRKWLTNFILMSGTKKFYDEISFNIFEKKIYIRKKET